MPVMCERQGRSRLRARRAGSCAAAVLSWCALALAVLAAGCSRTIGPALDDARLAFAVRTALVNDVEVGTAPIEVVATAGVVRLAGVVPSEAARERAVALAERVEGVVRVEADLAVRPAEEHVAVGPPPRAGHLEVADIDDWDRPLRFFAAGAALRWPVASSGRLEGTVALTPVFRFGRGRGWRPAFNITRVRAGLADPRLGPDPVADLRLTAVTGGIGHVFERDRWLLAVNATAGVSFNGLTADPTAGTPVRSGLPVAAGHSAALYPNASLWLEWTPRLSVVVSSGYLWTRPAVTRIEGDLAVRHTLRADVTVVAAGLAVWIF
jgi:hypothetical protein